MNINIPGLLCTAAVNCTHVGELPSPFTYIQPYRDGHACYIQGDFYRVCPPNVEDFYYKI